MRVAAGSIRRALLVPLLAGIAGCALLDDGRDPEQATPSWPAIEESFSESLRDLGRFPILPPTEDVYVGDVFASPQPPAIGEVEGTDRSGVVAPARWKSLRVLSELDEESRRRPTWPATSSSPASAENDSLYGASGPALRHRTVGLRATSSMRLEAEDLEPFLPLEVAPLIEGPATAERFAVSLQPGDAESYSLSIERLLEQLVDRPEDGGNARLKPEHMHGLPLVSDPATGKVYLNVISEVLYIQTVDAALRRRGKSPDGLARSSDHARAAAHRATEMNAAMAELGAEERAGGTIEFLTVSDDALTLRRSWPHPLAIAARGVTLEVDVASGDVLRTTPLGTELPGFEVAQEVDRAEEESEVLEERRRGAELEDDVQADRTRLYWDYGPRLDALNGNLSLFLGGRVHLDGATFDEDDQIDAAFGAPSPGLELRRGFLELGGVYGKFDFNLWANFSQGDPYTNTGKEVDFRNVFVGVRGVPLLDSVRAGFFKEDFGLEEITSSNDITFMERSLTDTFIERRNLGVRFQRRLTSERRMTVALGVFQDMDTDLETGTAYGVTGRITGSPVLSDDGRRVLHLGASATLRDPGDDGLRFLQQPESSQAQVLADTGLLAAEQDIRIGAEIGTVLGPLSLQSEAIVTTIEGEQGTPDATFWSTYVMASYVLTGESRSYRERVGAFGSVHPNAPLTRSGGRGAYEVAARYSYLDLDSGTIAGGKLHDLTLGLNWYANRNMRMMFNYVAASPEGFDVQHAFQARLQLIL